ncbi:N-acetyl-D-Glu racemase DgcA [Photobacterium sp. TY1-4]|uniref:N-acetyl-D-Glu racemase DgcA n=1 Tax=Photobacterium sp. TY1-4 TaxID=2899122 RepID=UPI0021BFA80D|nr:N-acetyl-D-Glu racemase DgcA [Photobacterium sp. TY1-4]UXI02971.1 L-Ala-D/L-Glu epimerase [Photobacterium sp. TY1-4]
MQIQAKPEHIPFAKPFRIARGARTHLDIVRVTITDGGHSVEAECTPYARYGEDTASVLAQIEQVLPMLAALSAQQAKVALQTLLPAGAARNALDCALWSLIAQQCNSQFPSPYFQLQPALETAMTVSIGTPQEMARQARDYVAQGASLLKVKLDAEHIVSRVAAVRDVAPDARIVLDANEAWTGMDLPALFEALAPLAVAMIEQPLPAGDDDALGHFDHRIPVCADESCHTRADLAHVRGRYEMINIKLDKTGGLTEALALKAAARQDGLSVMVGCMLGTSLAMRAALPIAQDAAVVDLDGPVLIGETGPEALTYRDGQLYL